MPEPSFIGVDLGGTKIYTALADHQGKILAEIKIPTEADGGVQHVLRRIGQTVEQVSAQAGAGVRPARLGIGAPGPTDSARGIVHQAPNLGWREVPLKELLEEALGLPVTVANDGNLAALGECLYGAGQGVADLIYVTVSTGIGGGFIFDGKLYAGASFAAAEIGHMTVDPDGPLCNCGNRGCLEAVASGSAMARRARELAEAGGGQRIIRAAGGKDKISALSVSRAAATGDREALAILAETGKWLGLGLANLINLLNPALILLGGGAMQAGKPLWEAMEREIKERALQASRQQVRLAPAGLGPRSGLLGAIALAIQSSAPGDRIISIS